MQSNKWFPIMLCGTDEMLLGLLIAVVLCLQHFNNFVFFYLLLLIKIPLLFNLETAL